MGEVTYGNTNITMGPRIKGLTITGLTEAKEEKLNNAAQKFTLLCEYGTCLIIFNHFGHIRVEGEVQVNCVLPCIHLRMNIWQHISSIMVVCNDIINTNE